MVFALSCPKFRPHSTAGRLSARPHKYPQSERSPPSRKGSVRSSVADRLPSACAVSSIRCYCPANSATRRGRRRTAYCPTGKRIWQAIASGWRATWAVRSLDCVLGGRTVRNRSQRRRPGRRFRAHVRRRVDRTNRS